jgi:L-iditol 2-dehydrogenase
MCNVSFQYREIMMHMMREIVLTGIRKMQVREVPRPRLNKRSDVLLKVEKIGVCGSDIHYFAKGKIGSQVVKYPFRVGHEFSASVAAAGSAVRNVKEGDRVAIDPAVGCGRCDQCRAGRSHTCRNILFLGCPGQLDGCMAEYITMPARCCCRIPNQMTLEVGALVEPLSIGVYGAEIYGKPVRGVTAGILGFGPIGASVLQSLLCGGARRIYVTDKLDYRVRTALKHGAAWAGNPSREDILRKISMREPQLLDVVFECCGQQDAVEQGIRLLKPGGALVLIGIPQVPQIRFTMEIMRRHELRVLNVRRQNECVEKAVHLMASRKGSIGYIVTHRFPLEKSQEAFELVDGYRDCVMKAMIEL